MSIISCVVVDKFLGDFCWEIITQQDSEEIQVKYTRDSIDISLMFRLLLCH